MQHLVASHGVLVAALCMENFLAVASAILQLDLQVDAVAPFVSQGFELGVFNHFYFPSGLQDRFASNGLLRDLVDEKVAVVQQSGDAEGEIHLRRGHALWLIGPTDVKLGSAGGANADLVDVLGADLGVITENFLEGID